MISLFQNLILSVFWQFSSWWLDVIKPFFGTKNTKFCVLLAPKVLIQFRKMRIFVQIQPQRTSVTWQYWVHKRRFLDFPKVFLNFFENAMALFEVHLCVYFNLQKLFNDTKNEYCVKLWSLRSQFSTIYRVKKVFF